MSDFDYDWHSIVNDYLESYSMDDGNIAEYIDGLVPIYYNDIWAVSQRLDLGHTIFSEMGIIDPEMTIYTLLQGAITKVYYSKFSEALVEMGVPELE